MEQVMGIEYGATNGILSGKALRLASVLLIIMCRRHYGVQVDVVLEGWE